MGYGQLRKKVQTKVDEQFSRIVLASYTPDEYRAMLDRCADADFDAEGRALANARAILKPMEDSQ